MVGVPITPTAWLAGHRDGGAGTGFDHIQHRHMPASCFTTSAATAAMVLQAMISS